MKVDKLEVVKGNGWSVVTERFVPYNEICIWPDNSWVMRDEYVEEDWKWHGDDFRIRILPDYVEEDHIDRLIAEGLI